MIDLRQTAASMSEWLVDNEGHYHEDDVESVVRTWRDALLDILAADRAAESREAADHPGLLADCRLYLTTAAADPRIAGTPWQDGLLALIARIDRALVRRALDLKTERDHARS